MSDNINVEVKRKNPSIPPKNLRELTKQVAEIEGTIDDINESVEEAEQDVNEIKNAIDNSNDFTIRNGKMVRKNKRYAPAQYSGLGEIYLEKNETFLGREFNEFVTNVTVPDPSIIADAIDGIVYDRHRKEFLAYELVEGERVYYAEWNKFDKWESVDDYTPDAGYDFICETDNKAYRWTEETTPDLIETEAHYGNVLKQEMVNLSNTIYHIQYDYDLIGKEIIIPERCVLQFEGGRLFKGTLIGNQTIIKNAEQTIFSDIHINGTWDCSIIKSSWFNNNKSNVLKEVFALTNQNIPNTVIIEPFIYEVETFENNEKVITLNDNTNVLLDGVVKLVNSNYRFHDVINTGGAKNVKICGNGSIIGNRDTYTGSESEFGFGINIQGKNISVEGIEISKFIGDAIIIGEEENNGNISNNITIKNCHLHDCRRQGISIINCNGAQIDNCHIHDINGTSPYMAIDIEPLYIWQQARNIKVLNCTIHDTRGIMTTTERYQDDTIRMSNIIIDNNFIYNNNYSCVTVRYTENAVIRNNILKGNGCMGCWVHGENIIVSNNDIHVDYSGEYSINNVIVLIENDAKNVKIDNNILYGENLYALTGCAGLVVTSNKITSKYFITKDTPKIPIFLDISIKNNIIYNDDFIWHYNESHLLSNKINCNTLKFDGNTCTISNNIIYVNTETDVSDKNAGIKLGEENLFNDNFLSATKTSLLVKSGSHINNNYIKKTAIFLEGSYGIISVCNNTIEKNFNSSFITINSDYCSICNNSFVIAGVSSTPFMIEATVDVSHVLFIGNISRGTYRIASATNNSTIFGIANLSTQVRAENYNNSITPRTFIKTGFANTGGTSERPILPNNITSFFFDETLKKIICWDKQKWIENDTANAGVEREGVTNRRPVGSDIYVGFMYFDTLLGKPIFASAISGDTVTWVDATGITV